uniref:Uncharacterized protein n=1 Tax=Riptortus pedestris TaxID=329032 RepID=R4WJG6_RIPPE|nr:hypothetical protein [Riptortus pedestris]
MVFSRSEVKRRTKESHDPLGENPKRTKVHAQRKFAQGSGMNSPIMTPIKEKEKSKPNNSRPAELLPSKRPTTEDFLSFLCFRGTKVLPPRLDYFNEASSSGRSDNVTANSSKQSSNSTSGTRKIKSRNSDPQIFKKNVVEQRTGLQKGNAMRARTASDERQVLRKTRIERQLRRKAEQRRVKTIRKTHPSILKRLGANRLRAGLRSGGQLPPGSEVGLKTDRKPKRGRPKRLRKKKKMDEARQKKLKQDEEMNDENDENENSDEEGEEEDEEEGEEESDSGEQEEKPAKKTSLGMRTRGASNSPALSPNKQTVSSRPSRKTKEAATLYMEMLTKDLRNPDEEFDDDDDYVTSFPELPSSAKREKEEEVKYGSPKRGKQDKMINSPNKGDNKSKSAKSLKSGKNKEDEEDDSETLVKRSQRLLVKKGAPKKANPKLKLQSRAKINRLRKPVKSPKKELIKKKGNKKSELNTAAGSLNDEDDDDGDDDYVNSSPERNDKKLPSPSGPSKGRYSKRIDQKKNEIEETVKEIDLKKRKGHPPSSSEDSFAEEGTSEIAQSTKGKKLRRSAENTATDPKVSKGPDNQKTKKSLNDNEHAENISKRGSTRYSKKEIDESEAEDSDGISKEKPSKKSKRGKVESDDEVVSRGRARQPKYKEDSDEELDSPKQKRESLQRKAKSNQETEDESEKSPRKPQRLRAKRKEESDEEFEEYSPKEKQILQRRTRNKSEIRDQLETTNRKAKAGSKAKNRTIESEDLENTKNASTTAKRSKKIDTDSEIIKGKRESSLRKVKYTEESDEELDSIEDTPPKRGKPTRDSDEELPLKQRRNRPSLQRKAKAKEQTDQHTSKRAISLRAAEPGRAPPSTKTKSKENSEEDSDDLISYNTRENRKNKDKSELSDEETKDKANKEELTSDYDEEDEDYKEVIPKRQVRKIKSKEPEEGQDSGLRKRGLIQKTKEKLPNENEANENQNKKTKQSFQKENEGESENEGDKKDKELETKRILAKDDTASKEVTDDDTSLIVSDNKNVEREAQSPDINDTETEKEKLLKKASIKSPCQEVEDEGKTKKNVACGLSKKKCVEGTENSEKEANSSSKDGPKKRSKKTSNDNEIIKDEKFIEAKSKFNWSKERANVPAKGDHPKCKPRLNAKAVELEANEDRKDETLDEECLDDIDCPELGKVDQKFKKIPVESVEVDASQKVRVMPRRGLRKGYEESDEEYDDEPVQIQRKQPLRKTARIPHYKDGDDDDDYENHQSPNQTDLTKVNVHHQKKIRKSNSVVSDKKLIDDELCLSKIKNEVEDVETISQQHSDNSPTDCTIKIKSEGGSDCDDKFCSSKMEENYTVKEEEKKEDMETNYSIVNHSKSKGLVKVEMKHKKTNKTDLNIQDSKRDGPLSKLKRNQSDEIKKNVQEVIGQKLSREQGEPATQKLLIEEKTVPDEQRRVNRKAKMPVKLFPEQTDSLNREEKLNRSSFKPFIPVLKEEIKTSNENLNTLMQMRESFQIKKVYQNEVGSEEKHIRKGSNLDIKKQKKNSNDVVTCDIRKSKEVDTKLKVNEDRLNEVHQKKSKEENFCAGASSSPEEKVMSKRITRHSIGSNEERVVDDKEKHEEEKPPRVSLRKPSLNAQAQLKKDDNSPKNPAPIKRKSLGERESFESGSSGITDCKVVIKSLGNISADSLKLQHKKAKTEDKNDSGNFSGESSESSMKNKPFVGSSIKNPGVDSSEVEKTDDKKDSNDKQKARASFHETWRQAFKNAKITKAGHLSPVPHTVKPFVRQKLPSSSFLGERLQGKIHEGSEIKAHEVNNKPNTPSNLSPFKSLMANQNQRSSSPDAKRQFSPAHKGSFLGFESPVRKNEETKADLRKYEAPVKSLTQLQYEKRSSEFISSLDSGPSVLPGFESIRAYKKEIKREEPKEVLRTEIPEVAQITEPTAKPSPEGKHLNLPLAVEHTLRKMSPITVSKKPPVKLVQAKTESLSLNKAVVPAASDKKTEIDTPAVTQPSPANPAQVPTNPVQPLPSTNIDLIVRDQPDLSFMAKKKVNMTNEEINRWLNDSTSSGIEHKKDCGIFENNQCECSYRTSGASMQNCVGVSELVPKDEKIDHGVVEPPVQLKELDKDGKYTAETISTCKVEEYKEKLLSKTNISENMKMAPPKPRRSSGQDRFKSNKSMTEEEMCEYDFRFERTSNSPRESVSDVSSVTHRDDASSSSEIPERKIFHQKRTSSKRPSISSPTAFSAENESSVYAFKPDPPSSTNRPFRRGRGKSGDIEDGKHPSSSSIAVQVNLETESVLESSTQTERSNDDNDGHLFYIPLPDEQLQSGVPHGVAVKLDTEGPDQRVIMRAKLVTKPSNTLPPSTSNSRGSQQSKKPEQKVRPMWSGRAVGTVPPTPREPQTTDQATTTAPEKSRSANQVAQSSQSVQVSQTNIKGPDSPRSRSGSKAHKSSDIAEPSSPPTAIEWKGTEFPPADIPATLVEAPTFYPDEKDFQDPLDYIEKLTPLAQSFGICRIVPPSNFKPDCKVSDDMRFTAYNQYVHRMMERWGPNVRELCAIKKYLATQSISLIQLPMIGSMEVDLPRLYQTVQQCGGLKEVIEKKRWAKVADLMRISKHAQDRVTKLDDIYCKYLLPYDTLSHAERTKLLEEVDEDWNERKKRLASDEEPGNNGSGEGSDESSDTDDNIFECITKGKNMPLSVFFRIARNTMSTWFKDPNPSPSEVETEFWRHVSTKTCHVCVHCGSIDSGTWGYGFPTTKTSATSRHPWNLKVLTNSPASILRSLGPLMGVTVPTLHVGMLFSSCCWYRDPHALPWIEYLHTGASKIWYGVPDSRAGELRKAMYPLLPRHIRDRKIWLPSDTMMVPPQFLLDSGVSLCRVVQEPRQFILVFPKAFTSSICTGYVVSESVYFAQQSWLNTAVQVFKDIQDSCEPPVFSLHKLLFNIANDSRSSADILIQVLPMLKAVIEKEVESRKKLEGLGLDSWERLPSTKSGRRKKKEEEQGDLECDTCRGALFLSVVTNSNEDCSYCIDHAIEALSKDESLVKCCKPMYAYDEEEMEELTEKVKSRIEAKTQKKQKEKGASSGTKN